MAILRVPPCLLLALNTLSMAELKAGAEPFPSVLLSSSEGPPQAPRPKASTALMATAVTDLFLITYSPSFISHVGNS
jgi:hypothetical protein